MKKLTKKAIESGFVDPGSLEQMKQWGLVDDEASEKIPVQASPVEADLIVEEVRDLLDHVDEIPEVKETVLDADNLFASVGQAVQVRVNESSPVDMVLAARDVYGNILIEHVGSISDLVARRGTRILWEGTEYDVIEVRPSYVGDRVRYYVCAVQEVPDHAKML